MVPNQAEYIPCLPLRALPIYGCLSDRDSDCLPHCLFDRLCKLQPAGMDTCLVVVVVVVWTIRY